MADQPPVAEILRFLPLGDAAVTVELGDEIGPAVHERVVEFASLVRRQSWTGVLDIVPTYRSVTVHVDPLRLDVSALMDLLRSLPRSASRRTLSSGTAHTIPVLYGGAGGPDLEDVAAFAGLSVAETVRLHASIEYRVYMLGFSPGFPYLGTVPKPIAMPRLPTPRTTVPAGSVGIAGSQTGIYPIATPGGWRLIGRTPLRLYRPADSSPFLFSPGDLVRFEPVGPEEFERLLQPSDVDAR